MAATKVFDKEKSLPVTTLLGKVKLSVLKATDSKGSGESPNDLWAEAKEVIRVTLEQIHRGVIPNF